jgi:hypothetical protein
MTLTILTTVLPPGHLDDLVQDMLDHNIPPIFLSRHDGWGFVGERQRAAIELLDARIGELTSEQRQAIWDEAGSEGEFLVPSKTDEHLAMLILKKATHPLFFALPDSIFADPQPADRVFRQYPELLEGTDNRGLLTMQRTWNVDPEALFYKDHALSYHQLLRRAFTSNLNAELIDTLIECWRENDATELRLALDGRRLLPAEQFSVWMEKDFWDGPPLSEDRLDEPQSVDTVTRHGESEPSLLYPYWQFLARWSYDAKQEQKTCEMEELVWEPRPEHCPYVLVRYMHSIRDVRKHVFIHADGAVRGYLPETYAGRLVHRSVSAAANPEIYRKVWRLDGEIATGTWSHLVARWFRGNRLVQEYLGDLLDAEASSAAAASEPG